MTTGRINQIRPCCARRRLRKRQCGGWTDREPHRRTEELWPCPKQEGDRLPGFNRSMRHLTLPVTLRDRPREGGKRHVSSVLVPGTVCSACVSVSISYRAQTRPGRPKPAFFTTDQVAYSKQLVARARGLTTAHSLTRCRPRARSARVPSEHSNG